MMTNPNIIYGEEIPVAASIRGCGATFAGKRA
jgi:hypothetical protein